MEKNEGTVPMNGGQTTVPPQLNQNAAKQNVQGKKTSNGWQRVAIGGVAGIMLAGGGMAYAAKMDSDNDSQQHNSSAGHDTASHNAAGQSSAQSSHEAHVDDNLSFKDAFDSARAQVGPGGVFEWHGNVYSTATESEWNASHHSEHQSADDSADASNAHHTDPTTDSDHTSTPDSNHDTPQEPAQVVDHEVQVLGVEEGVVQGQAMTYADIVANNQEAVVIDVNHDGVYDVLWHDTNNDGDMQRDELSNIQEAHFTVEQSKMMMDNENEASIHDSDGNQHDADSHSAGFVSSDHDNQGGGFNDSNEGNDTSHDTADNYDAADHDAGSHDYIDNGDVSDYNA
ncbi:MAG: hypothetical protein LKF31_06580 [Muribaculaceae bacterium]|jgi:hypothetical protein|nr:hypothetical protein [Muribaculaceae bacterium]